MNRSLVTQFEFDFFAPSNDWRHIRKILFVGMLVALGILGLVGCPNMPIRNQLDLASTANKQYTERTTVLLENDLITPQDAAERLVRIKQARDAIRLGALALDRCQATGDLKCAEASNRLGIAQTIGAQIEAELLKKEIKK